MKRQPGAIGTRKQPRNESPLSQRALSLGRRTKSLLREPLPFVLQRALEDFRVTYELNAYCEDPERMYPLYSELHRNIQDVFNEHGVQIMTPAYVTDPEEPKIVPQSRWYEPPASSN